MGSSEISSKVDVSRSVGCLIIASVHLWSVAANPLKKQHTHIKYQRTHALLDSTAQMPKNTCTAGLHSSTPSPCYMKHIEPPYAYITYVSATCLSYIITVWHKVVGLVHHLITHPNSEGSCSIKQRVPAALGAQAIA